MSLSARYLPRATPLDPAEDPPGSIDPLGTLGPAERIAEVLFPGFTARMWRPLLLTFVAVAALVAGKTRGSGLISKARGSGLIVDFRRARAECGAARNGRERARDGLTNLHLHTKKS